MARILRNSILTSPVFQTYYDERVDTPAINAGMGITGTSLITEGIQLFQIDFAPVQVGNRIIVEAQGHGVENSNVDNKCALTLFIDDVFTSRQFAIESTATGLLNSGSPYLVKSFISAGSLIDIEVRIGVGGPSVLNQKRDFGNVVGDTLTSWIRITEVSP